MPFLHVTQSECLFMSSRNKGGTAIYVVPTFCRDFFYYLREGTRQTFGYIGCEVLIRLACNQNVWAYTEKVVL